MIELPVPLDFDPDITDLNRRDVRRAIAIAVEAKASRKQLGDKFDQVSVSKFDRAGDPLELSFTYTGQDRLGTEAVVLQFVRDLANRLKSNSNFAELRQSAVTRRLSEFGSDLVAVRQAASRTQLGRNFVCIDGHFSKPDEDGVVFAFHSYDHDDNARAVEAFARLRRSGTN